MVSALRHTPAALALAALAFSLARCGGDVAPTTPDAGDVLACETQAECPSGQRCEGGICIENRCDDANPCPAGFTCDQLSGECKASGTGTGAGTSTGTGTGTGTSTGTATGTGTGTPGGPCATKYDCPAGQICKSGACKAADLAKCNTDQDCPRGKICNFSKQCEDGCVDSKDCDGGKLCQPQKFVCEACSQSNPCPKDAQGNAQQCVAGQCTKSESCNTTQDCVNKGLDGSICNTSTKTCSNCTSLADCSVDPYKGDTSGPSCTSTCSTPGYICQRDPTSFTGGKKCVKPGRTCTSAGVCKQVSCTDESCGQATNPLAYCNTALDKCDTYECLSDNDCRSNPNGTVCDLSTKTCSGGSSGCTGATLTQCQNQCAGQGQVCNPARCGCDTNASGTGTTGASCTGDTDCATGYSCFSGICDEKAVDALTGGDCDPLMCALGGFIGVPTCVGGATGAQCDPTGCLLGLLGGGSGGTPCSGAGGGTGPGLPGGGGTGTGTGGGSGTGAPGDPCTVPSDCASGSCTGAVALLGLPGVCD